MFKNKKFYAVLVSIVGILLVFLALGLSTYALFSNEAYGSNPETYSTGTLSITAKSKSETISLTNALPMTDDDGKKSNPYVFTIKNEGNLDYQFDVKLLSTGSNTFSPEYIKLQIDDSDVKTLNGYSGGTIKKGVILKAGQSIDISIRIWLDINTPNTQLGKSFESKIVTSGQAVYIRPPEEVTIIINTVTTYPNESTKEPVISNLYTNTIVLDSSNNYVGTAGQPFNNGKEGAALPGFLSDIRFPWASVSAVSAYNCDNNADITIWEGNSIGIGSDLYDSPRYNCVYVSNITKDTICTINITSE